MAWSHVICNTLTGERILPVFPSGGQWATGINGNIGTGSHPFQTRDGSLSAATWRSLMAPWSRTLVSCWDDVPQHAGIIMGHEYSASNGMLTVNHAEFRSAFSRRLVTSGATYSPDAAFTVTGKSLRGLARAVIARYTSGIGAGFDFPVVLPADEAGSQSRRWPFYEFATAEDLLSEIEKADGGPDIYFRPRWSPATGRLEWVAEIGSPTLTGPAVEWVVGAEDAAMMGVAQRTDATKTLTGIVALGKGSEQDMKLGFAGGLGTFPVWLDATRSYKSIGVATQLDARALGELRSVEKPTVQMSVRDIPAGLAFPNLRVGSRLTLLVSGDTFLDDGPRALRVIGLSGGVGETIGVQAI